MINNLILNSFIDSLTNYWIVVSDRDPRAVGLYLRHYSARQYKDGRGKTQYRAGFIGPCEKLVLLTATSDALFAWAKPKPGMTKDGQEGVRCSIFRNEGALLSSDLIKEACQWAWTRWPGERLYTYVWDAKVKSPNPGYCFKKAGWHTVGHNKDGRLTLLAIKPSESC